ncbi:MAG: hypothetical protein MR409_06150 [Lachnospiraceae bacterium]|nr:hypothetical protein [Lachnospiraceae bacterium]
MGTQKSARRLISMLLLGCTLFQAIFFMSGCSAKPEVKTKIKKSENTVTLNVYDSQSSYYGLQKGWMAEYLKDKFNIKLNIITGMELSDKEKLKEEKKADIIIFRDADNDYSNAVREGLLYDWGKDNLLEEHGEYINEHMQDAIKANQKLNNKITVTTGSAVYGIGDKVAWSKDDHQDFFYSWDARWDLYKKLDCPDVENLNDYINVLEDMKNLYVSENKDEEDEDKSEADDVSSEAANEDKPDEDNEVYAVSVWNDWDEDAGMVNCVKDMVSAYYGYEPLGLGFYDSENDKYIGLLDSDSPYLEMVEFYHILYKKGLLDPISKDQSYDDVVKKVKEGKVLTSLVRNTGSDIYNTSERIDDNNMMCSLKPNEATPLVYGIGTQGNKQITAIGSSTKNPELCMDIINYFVTPEGRMTMSYGPRGVTWDYDENGKIHFTRFGNKCQDDPKTEMEEPFTGTFIDGTLKASFSSWAEDAENPDSNSETYNSKKWSSNAEDPRCILEQEWMDFNNCDSRDRYFEKKGCVVADDKSDKIEVPKTYEKKWYSISEDIIKDTWEAIYADTDNRYNKIIEEMTQKARKNGYDGCVWWWRGKIRERGLEVEQ